MRKIISAGVAVGVVAALGFAMPATAVEDSVAELSVLHAVPDLPVDVYVNGELTLDDFNPGDLAGPLELAPGDYEVAVTAADAADDSAPVIGPATVTLEGGNSYTAVAHLTEAGEPTLTPYVNDISTTDAGFGRLTVRHTAAAPAVDILASGTPVIEGLTNPGESTLNLGVATVSASVALAGTTDPVIGPADVEIKDGVLTIVYAWGSAADENLDLAVQEIQVGHSNPDGVPSGTAGYAAQRDAMIQTGWTVGAAAFLAIGIVSIVMIRRSRVES